MPPPLCQFLRLLILIATLSTLLTALDANGLIKPNVLLICVDDLRPELKSFGANYVKSPNMDKLAAQGRPFHRHYVQAPTCGASRYTLLTGKYGPSHNGALFARSNHIQSPSIPAWFRKNGYVTVSVGKVSHHPGGRGGTDWNEDDKPEMFELAETKNLAKSQRKIVTQLNKTLSARLKTAN